MKHWNKEIAKEINPQITIKITKEDVVDILSSAIGGISYWGEIVPNDRQYEEAKKWLLENAEPDYDDGEICYEEVVAQILFDGKSLEITDIENDKKYFLSLEKLFIGLRAAIEEGYYSHYNWYVPKGDGFGEWQLNCCQVDSAVADIIIQFSLFGEVLFG